MVAAEHKAEQKELIIHGHIFADTVQHGTELNKL